MSIAITVVTLLVLLLTKCEQRTLEGSREYFREMHQAMPPIRREEVLSLAAFIAAAVLTFARELYKQWLRTSNRATSSSSSACSCSS